MARHFVKFVPFNLKVITSLVNRTIKFSTVYEFNDFNELRYMQFPGEVRNEYLFNNYLKEKIKDCDFYHKLISELKKQGRDAKFILDLNRSIESYLQGKNRIPENYLQYILEHMAFLSVGIFCVSHVDVFEDDCARLMFAHYADKLKGLALIYAVKSPIQRVEYTEDSCSSGNAGRLEKWLNNEYEDMGDFLKKTCQWKYEKEYRIFGRKGIRSIDEYDVKLKAILHTSRLDHAKLTLLKNINEKIYNGGIKIETLDSLRRGYFKIKDEKSLAWIDRLN